MKKRVVQALGCILAMTMVVGSLTACGGKSEKKAEKKAGSDVKVAIICSAAGQNDNGYNQSAVEGAKKAADEFGIEYKVVEPTTGVPQALESLADDGYNVIFNLEYDFEALIQGTGGAQPIAEIVLRGRNEMLEFEPDLIVGLGGGSAMDAAKAMWIFYEHPELTQMEDILPPNEFPKLRGKARMCCIPSTSGTASEVSRSIVISDNEKGLKHGVGNMEMMPDIAICDPEVTMSMPAKITAETGMDALTHALEALASNRANYLSDILASQAAQDIMETLPTAYENGNDIKARETMVQASMVAGIAFTNVSLGIVHSMAHTIGGIFHVSHGLADAIILPYIIRYNEQNETAKEVYAKFAKRIGAENLHEAVEALNEKLNIPKCFKEIIPDEEKYMEKLDEMAPLAKADGCTKTNPVIPEIDEFKELFIKVYRGE